MAHIVTPAGRPATGRPVLITDAAMSKQQEYASRRRRYGTLMAGRVVCIIAAVVAGSVLSNLWVAGAFIALAAALPWAAVLIANDRLPTARRAHPIAHLARAAHHRQLPPAAPDLDTTSHRVIDA